MDNRTIIGIDVSKLSLDIFLKESNKIKEFKIKNSYIDIKDFLKEFKKSIVFYETTGIYSNKLCKACNDLQIVHYQVNPFVMCKINDGLGDRNKTDKIDASKIAQVGEMLLDMYKLKETKFKLIIPSNNQISQMNHYVSVINSLRNQISRFKQLLEKLNQDIYTDKKVTKFYEKQLKDFQEKQSKIYEQLEEILIRIGYQNQLENIGTIPTINKKFGAELLSFFIQLTSKGIEKQDRSKLKAYVGIDPNDKISGSALNKVHISRKGNKKIRSMFYMSGMKWYQLINYERYKETDLGKFFIRMNNKFTVQGSKHGKRVIIAMSKKLLMVAWGIYWNNKPYDWRK